MSSEAVAQILLSLRNGTITDVEWDYFMSVQLADAELEEIRESVARMWQEGSSYMVAGSLDPRDLSPKGAAELDRLIRAVQQMANPSARSA